MSDELNKEMEEVVEEESVEEAVAPKAKKTTEKLKQQPHDMQKSQGGPTASDPKANSGDKSFKSISAFAGSVSRSPLLRGRS
mgnify:CR=1 FL=1